MKYYIVPLLFIRRLPFLFAQGATAHIEVSVWLRGQPEEAELIAASLENAISGGKAKTSIVGIGIQSAQSPRNKLVPVVVQLKDRLRPHHLGRAIFLCRASGVRTMRTLPERNNDRSVNLFAARYVVF